jgi:hypothetical protein
MASGSDLYSRLINQDYRDHPEDYLLISPGDNSAVNTNMYSIYYIRKNQMPTIENTELATRIINDMIISGVAIVTVNQYRDFVREITIMLDKVLSSSLSVQDYHAYLARLPNPFFRPSGG